MSADTWPTEAMVEAARRTIHDYYCSKDYPCGCAPELLSHLAAKAALEDALDAAPKEWSVDRGVPLRPFRKESHAREAAQDWRLRGVDAHLVSRTAAGPWTREDNA